MISRIASAILNDVQGGLSNITNTINMSLDQLEDEVVETRLQVIKEYQLKNIVPRNDLLLSINCIDVDCKSLDKCPCGTQLTEGLVHFEIPQIINDFEGDAIEFIGSVNREVQFKVYTSIAFQFHKYVRRGKDKPYVYIEPTPNANNMYDGWIFNAPFIKKISIIGLFKDPRQLEQYDCCRDDSEQNNFTSIDLEVKRRLTETKIKYYRQLYQVSTNTQTPK